MKKDILVPRLRTDLEVVPTSYRGEKGLLVRDFLGLIENPIILQGDALNLVGLIDGKKTIRDLQVELVRLRKGVLFDTDNLEKLLQELDSACLLQSTLFLEKREKLINDYARLGVREAVLADRGYPGDRKGLQLYLDSILETAEEAREIGREKICALVAPHIDLEVGKRIYARAYRAIKGMKPRTIFLLGTGHYLSESYYSLTEKDFQTPLGLVKTDRKIVRELKEQGSRAVSSSDIYHRKEHSLEFQILFLQHLFGTSFSLVPILCGSFSRKLGGAAKLSQLTDVAGFLNSLKIWREKSPQPSLFIVGADFSHIGLKFGHSEIATSLLLEARKHDLALIEALCRCDGEAFWAESRRVQDRYNVCGFSALASLLEVISASRGHLLDYEFWREDPTRSAVSFAALAFTIEDSAKPSQKRIKRDKA